MEEISAHSVSETAGNTVHKITINVPVVYMVRYKVVLRGDYTYGNGRSVASAIWAQKRDF